MKKINKEKLANKIQEKRKVFNITQDKLGEKTGINRQIVGRIEAGKVIPSIEQLEAILEILDIDFEEIIDTSEKEDVFMAMKGDAMTKGEREGLDKMISMMLCLKKHDRLRGMYHGK